MQLTQSVKHLLIINVLVFFAVNGLPFREWAYQQFSMYYPFSEFSKPWQLVTHMFMHANPQHLIFNMMSLFFFGPLLEMNLGTKRFLTLYFACGLAAAIFQTLFFAYQYHYLGDSSVLLVKSLGASGATSGVFFAVATLFPNLELYMLFIPIPIKAKYMAIGFLVSDLFYGFSGSMPGIAHFAHVGGAILGFLIIYKWLKK
ncbi:MAG: rhomboid family intramembrane serine protease [Saprospiraceae bacterium]|nr:rhomboid family intramembrane serine protease [Saprospiraceae bacterium]